MEHIETLEQAVELFSNACHPLPYLDENFFWIPRYVSHFETLIPPFECVTRDRHDAVQNLLDFAELVQQTFDFPIDDCLNGILEADNLDADNAMEGWNLIAYLIRDEGHQLYVTIDEVKEPDGGSYYDCLYQIV